MSKHPSLLRIRNMGEKVAADCGVLNPYGWNSNTSGICPVLPRHSQSLHSVLVLERNRRGLAPSSGSPSSGQTQPSTTCL
jgi:hypothetical protein